MISHWMGVRVDESYNPLMMEACGDDEDDVDEIVDPFEAPSDNESNSQEFDQEVQGVQESASIETLASSFVIPDPDHDTSIETLVSSSVVLDPDHGTPVKVFVSSSTVPDPDPDTEQGIHVVQEIHVV